MHALAERGIDEQTLDIRAVEFTGSGMGDAPMLPELLDQIPPEQGTGSVTADGAYNTRKCHNAGAYRPHPQAANNITNTDQITTILKTIRSSELLTPTEFQRCSMQQPPNSTLSSSGSRA